MRETPENTSLPPAVEYLLTTTPQTCYLRRLCQRQPVRQPPPPRTSHAPTLTPTFMQTAPRFRRKLLLPDEEAVRFASQQLRRPLEGPTRRLHLHFCSEPILTTILSPRELPGRPRAFPWTQAPPRDAAHKLIIKDIVNIAHEDPPNFHPTADPSIAHVPTASYPRKAAARFHSPAAK